MGCRHSSLRPRRVGACSIVGSRRLTVASDGRPRSTSVKARLDDGLSRLYPRLVSDSVGIRPLSSPASTSRPIRLSFFVLSTLVDMFVVVFAVVTILGYLGLPQILGSGAFVEIWGSRYTLDPPTYPWVAGALAVLSVSAAWFAKNGRRFDFVLAVALGWVGLGLAAIATGSGPGLFAQRTVWALLLVTSRSWFRS